MSGAEAESTLTGRVFRDGRVERTQVLEDELAALVADPDLVVWIDLLRPTPADIRRLATQLDLGPGTVEDLLAPFERPKIVRHQSHMFFQVYATRLLSGAATRSDHSRLQVTRISGIVTPVSLVTVRADDTFDIEPVVQRWTEASSLLTDDGGAALVHGLLDAVVDGHFETIQALDDDIEALEDVLFEERQTGHDFLRRVYGVRKDLVRLRRVVLPMREVVNSLLRHRNDGNGRVVSSTLDAWYDDLYDHVLRASEWTESLRDMVTSVFETNLSLQDARLNTVMKKLAGWAAIIAVPTAITGWFGQNVPYPGFSNAFGLAQSALLIVGISAGLYVLFKRRDWL